MFSLCLFVRLLAGLRKYYSTDFTTFSGKVAPWATEENPLDFGGNPDDVASGLG